MPGVTSFNAGDIILGGDGSDLDHRRGGDDIIDGDKWLNVRISVRENSDGTGNEIFTANSMTELTAKMFDGTYNPGQLVIVREIIKTSGIGDTDVAVFSGDLADYDIIFNPNGTVSVAHTRGTATDGTDTIRNVETLRFADQDFSVSRLATGAAVIGDQTPTEGQTVTANTSSIADQNGLGAFSYQWQSSVDGTTWANIAGATSVTFTPQDLPGMAFGAQAGRMLRLEVSFTDLFGFAELRTSAATGPTGVNWAGDGGNNTLNGTAGDDVASGNGGDDTLNGAAGADVLNGNAGNDTLNGGTENDALNGGLGTDILRGGTGVDIMIGGDGSDSYEVDDAGDIVFEFAGQGTDTVFAYANYTLADNVENLAMDFGTQTYGYGNGSNNSIVGNAQANVIEGRGGNDNIDGRAGNDDLDGGSGNDNLTGGSGDDLLIGGTGTDVMVGGTGNDSYSVDNLGDSSLSNRPVRAPTQSSPL